MLRKGTDEVAGCRCVLLWY